MLSEDSFAGKRVTVIRLRKSHYTRLFCASVQRVSLPYLAFSSNPALRLRHFLWALSTCSPYCAGIFYIWREVGLPQLVRRSPFFNSLREIINWKFSRLDRLFLLFFFFPFLRLLIGCWKDNMRKHDPTMHFSLEFLNVMLSLVCYWQVALARAQIISVLKRRRNKKRAKLIDILG